MLEMADKRVLTAKGRPDFKGKEGLCTYCQGQLLRFYHS